MTDNDITEEHSFGSCLQPLALTAGNTIFSSKTIKHRTPSFPVTSNYCPSLNSLAEPFLNLGPKLIQTEEYDQSNKSLSYKTFYENWLRYFYLLVQQNNLHNSIDSVEELQKQIQIYNNKCKVFVTASNSNKETACNNNNNNDLPNTHFRENTRDDLLTDQIAYDSDSECESLLSNSNQDLVDSKTASNGQTDNPSLRTSSKSQRLKTMIQEKEDRISLNDDLAEIYEFAHLFKLRRLSLGLTQTQVGASLNAKEGPAYSQSAICRFEKLDVTLKSAKRMKPVLERWLSETQAMHHNGANESFGAQLVHRPPRKRKRRTCFSTKALKCLLHQLERNPYPTKAEMTELAKALTYDREVIRVWFCNRRQAIKTTEKQTTSVHL
ncbi:putative pou6f1/brn-5 [Schistosoma mansoni]|uniref:putative pou6f1/brn-5 n=1 Tax=Schistosoma mansoni TaxID=6183 RepID=UPI0001A638CE|nr:putative pou6f1/brn-5 [Schistosoma mansoni]|eukprot:XP_018654212.1 putative pou6f1/brn-5 [Schistosoma mansoni]